jgi:hypothetical protein
LIERQKITHIYHWANPFVNTTNFLQTYAVERDIGFDIVIHVKPDKLDNMYEITSGDEDILFSVASGSLPICGIDHLEYDEDTEYLGKTCGVTFGKDTTASTLRELVDSYMLPVRWNDTFAKCKNLIDSRSTTSPRILGSYFAIFLGKELAEARRTLASETKTNIENNINN